MCIYRMKLACNKCSVLLCYYMDLSTGAVTVGFPSHYDTMLLTALYASSSPIASSYSLSTTFACAADLGENSHWNGSGMELKPSV